MPSSIKRVPEALSVEYSEVERAWDGMIPLSESYLLPGLSHLVRLHHGEW